ncbi:NAD-dependent epimerase/dehydratase family protein [Micromonospora sp. NPDC005215]|uniref:NAD-dependent epimerase/dehydratase family protein n=1 Tax=Micromonospora sp. NPDC005215 TaxID=3157024 RepID=UPI0033AB6217
MRLLILGGTTYLGRHLAEHALRAGHEVTLFNRGRTGKELFPGVPRLIGDRTADGDPAGLTALGTGTWDTVFDFSGFHPRQVTATAGLLAPRIGRYVFMSSIAVYPPSAEAGRTEDSPLLRAEPDDGEYGNLKVACEEAAEAAMPGRATSVRAGLISGPGDPFGAFTSWALGMAGAKVVPCAARASQPVQVTDVRDLAAFLLRVGPGPFNVVPPPITFAQMLETCRRAGGGTATVTWTRDENVDDLGGFIVQPRDGSADGAFQLSGERARLAGYRPRPFAETARDTIEWALRTTATFTNPH